MSDTELRKLIRDELEKATFKIITEKGTVGTGFFIGPEGYFLTAFHCIKDMLARGSMSSGNRTQTHWPERFGEMV